MSALLEAALERAREGARVIPLHSTDADGVCDCWQRSNCEHPGKHPRTQHGLSDASSDPSTIKRWWTQWPNANIGVVADDFPRIDIDDSSIADQLLADPELRLLTEVVRTRKGVHITFHAPGTATSKLRLADGRVIGDVKGVGGYVVVSPSRIGGFIYSRLSPEWVEPLAVVDPVGWLGERLAQLGHTLAHTRDRAAYRDVGAQVGEGGRHDAILSHAGLLYVDGISEGAFVAALHGVNEAICVPPLPPDEVESIARHFLERRERRSRVGVVEHDPAMLGPTIMVSSRHLHDIAEDGWTALQAANQPPRLFLHGLDVGEVTRDAAGRSSIRHLAVAGLRGRLDRCADWVKETKTGSAPARPPKDVVEDMLALEKPLPPIKGIVGTPTFASDGSLDCQPGYQPSTQLYYEPAGDTIPPISAVPDATDLKRAKAYLHQEWLADFPFLEDASLAHAIAVPLTVIARELIDGPTPLFAIDAPAPGSGKGLLASGIGIIVSGREAAVMTETRGEEERKRITALIRAGHPLMLLDNVKHKIESGTFAAMLTAPYWSDRILGVTQDVQLPVRGVWMATGNNLQFDSDISRRTVWIRIDARVDRPWERSNFQKDNLVVWVRRHRHELVWACLVLVQHWIASGRTEWRGKPLGSYESWSAVVGGILNAAGIPGFLANRNALYSRADTETEEWRSFTRRWHDEYRGASVKSGELLELAQNLVPSVFERARDNAGDRALKTRLGKALSQRRDRSFDGMFIRHAGEDSHDGGALWRLDCGTSDGSDASTSAHVPQETEPISDTSAEHAEQAEDDLGVDPTFHDESGVAREAITTPKPYPHVPHLPQADSDPAREPADVVRNVGPSGADVPQCKRCRHVPEMPTSTLCDACRREALRRVLEVQQ